MRINFADRMGKRGFSTLFKIVMTMLLLTVVVLIIAQLAKWLSAHGWL